MPAPGESHRTLRRRAALGAVYLLGGVAFGALLSLMLHVAHPATAATPASPHAATATLARQPAPGFSLTDQNGAAVSLASARGHVVLLTFMDPQCRSLCPVMGRDIAALERALPKSVQPELLLVSVSPGRTNADVQQFLAMEHPDWQPGWHWLLGPSEASLKLVWLKWHIAVEPAAGDVTHDALLAVIDPQGFLRVEFPAPLPIDDATHDITSIAHE